MTVEVAPNKPDVIYSWAVQDLTDDITGSANKIAPTIELQESGLIRDEPIGRQYYNAMLENLTLNVQWLEAQLALAIEKINEIEGS